MLKNKRLLTLTGVSLVVIWGVALSLLLTGTDTSDTGEVPTLAKLPSLTPSQAFESAQSADMVALAAVLSSPTSAPVAEAAAQQIDVPREPVSNRMVIHFAEQSTRAERDAYIDSIGGTVSQSIDALNIITVDVAAVSLPPSPIVVATEPDYYVTALTDDPYFAQQWALPIIGAPDAWLNTPADSPKITVAVIDSGVCADHIDLSGRIVPGWDYVQNDSVPQDEFGHGCGVAGIIAAIADNGTGIAGVAPNAQIMALRVLDAQGLGTYSNVAAAIIRATDSDVKIINLSLGGYSASSMLENAVNYAVARGVLVIAAAGNTGTTTVLYPAAYNASIAVGSVDENLLRASFSSYGPSVDVWAPGQGIVVTALNNGYNTTSGTSFAAPHVAGIAALELAHGGSLQLGGVVHYSGGSATPTPTLEPTVTSQPVVNTSKMGRPIVEETIETVVTDTWAVILTPGSDPNAVAVQLGFQNLGQIGILADTYLFQQQGTGESLQAAQNAASALDASSQVVWFEQQVARQQTPRAPNDPLYANQWHLKNMGQFGGTPGEDINVEAAWDLGYDGTGVVIAVVDDGLQYTHPDLAPNYNAFGSYDFNYGDSFPLPDSTTPHGTAVGGVAAGRDNGPIGIDYCGVGSAYRATLSGIRLIALPSTDAIEASALTYRLQHNHIYTNSWGPSLAQFGVAILAGPGPVTRAALQNGVTSGRGGLGSIYLWAAGNDNQIGDDVNGDGYANLRFAIAVGAVDNNGIQSYYSEVGAPLLVVAPSGGDFANITTTDLLGPAGWNGYTDEGCTNQFSGTSSSTPLVAGVVALMLDANPNLTWRDVQHILVQTSEKNDPFDSDWVTNGAGLLVNHKYGFGRVDAAAAVIMAETWTNVPPETSASTAVISVNTAIPDGLAPFVPGAPVVSSVHLPSDMVVEHVEVVFNATHPFSGDVMVSLISPEGTRSELMTVRTDPFANFTNWSLTSTHHWGEQAGGTWTIEVRDGYPIDTGIFKSWQLKVYGTLPPPTAPTNLTAVAISQGEVALEWQDNEFEVTNYRVERSPDGVADWVEVATVNAPAIIYTDNNLICNSTYYYRVRAFRQRDGMFSPYSSVSGDTTFACPPNADFAAAIVIGAGSLPYSDNQGNYGGNLESGEQDSTCDVNAGRSLWYQFTPDTSGTYILTTAGSDYNTTLSVWTGSTLGDLTQVACDDDTGPGPTSYLFIALDSATTYQIRVTGKNGAYGNMQFRLSMAVPPTATPFPSAIPTATTAPMPATSRIGLYRDSVWSMSNTTAGGFPDLLFSFGLPESGWYPVVGNWDGDPGQEDTIGLYKNGQFWLRNVNETGLADVRFIYGPLEAGWIPVAGDWNGDGDSTVGVYKNGEFWLASSHDYGAPSNRFVFGPLEAGWIPVAGDWNGDGIDTIGVYKNGEWQLKNSNSAGQPDLRFIATPPGGSNWLPVVGDWDKDGLDTVGLYSGGMWWLRNGNSTGFADLTIFFGSATDSGWLPIAGRWDGTLALGIPLVATSVPTAIAPTLTPTLEPTLTVTPTATETPSPTPSETPTALPPSPTETPSETPTLVPTETPTADLPSETPAQ